MHEWQPIETAPSKTEVLLLWTYPKVPVPVYHIRIGRFICTSYEAGAIFRVEIDLGDFCASAFTDKNDAPTHWMPLPTPPVSA